MEHMTTAISMANRLNKHIVVYISEADESTGDIRVSCIFLHFRHGSKQAQEILANYPHIRFFPCVIIFQPDGSKLMHLEGRIITRNLQYIVKYIINNAPSIPEVQVPPAGIPKDSIDQVKDLIEDGRPSLKLIEELLKRDPTCALLWALKASVYASLGRDETLWTVIQARQCFQIDPSVLPEVLHVLKSSCLSAGLVTESISLLRDGCQIDSENLELLMELFDTYSRESSFTELMKISYRMYRVQRSDKFLLWTVFSIQMQIFRHFLGKHMATHHFTESEGILVCITVPEQPQPVEAEPVRQVLSTLGLTLLAVECDGLLVKRGRLLSHVSNYVAAAGVLRGLSESLDLSESLFQDLNHLLSDEVSHVDFFTCKLSQLSEDGVVSYVSHALHSINLEHSRERCLGDLYNDELELSLYEYFNRVGYKPKVPLQLLSKDEEHEVITELLQAEPLASLEVLFSAVLANRAKNIIHSDAIPLYVAPNFGTMSYLKMDNFIVLGTDGVFMTGLTFDKFEEVLKVRQFGNMGVGFTGNWAGLEEIVGPLKKLLRSLKSGEEPTVRSFMKHVREQTSSVHKGDFSILVTGFDQTQEGLSPCVWSAGNNKMTTEMKTQFGTFGTGSYCADKILRKIVIPDHTGLAVCIDAVEKSLANAYKWDGCTAGEATIAVIHRDGNFKLVAKVDLSTLLSRHYAFLGKNAPETGTQYMLASTPTTFFNH